MPILFNMELETVNVIFTRHELTPKQKVCIRDIVIDCSDLAKLDINNTGDAIDIIKSIRERVKGYDTVSIYGVIPVPLREVLHMDYNRFKSDCTVVYIYEAWNIQRSIEGQKPSFEFKEWCMTGEYYFPR